MLKCPYHLESFLHIRDQHFLIDIRHVYKAESAAVLLISNQNQYLLHFILISDFFRLCNPLRVRHKY